MKPVNVVVRDTRKLSSEYRDLVEFINDKKRNIPLSDFIYNFIDDNSHLNDIVTKLDIYYDEGSHMDKFISIIVDVYNGNYELEEKKYYVKMPKMIFPYLIQGENGSFDWCSNKDNVKYKYQFTMSEIEAIDPRYKAFAIPVED